jgi:hypothetical protein
MVLPCMVFSLIEIIRDGAHSILYMVSYCPLPQTEVIQAGRKCVVCTEENNIGEHSTDISLI